MSGREARRNSERLQYKFIVKYIENVHNDIYDKVMDLYQETKKANPNVKDLTKTEQFMSAAMPGTPVPRYYTTRNLGVNKSTPLIQGGPTMVLEIPLEKQQSAPVVPVPQQPLPSTQTPSSTTQPLLMPDDMYLQLLAELQKDPNLEQILNDFQPLNNDIDDDMNPFVQDDLFMIDDQSLLESEIGMY